MEEAEEKKGYGKRPMWQWILLYLVIAVILYGGFYYFFLAKKGGYNYNSPTSTYSTPAATNTSPTAATSGEIIMTSTNAKGNFLTDSKGMTLYIFDNDTKGVSNCSGSCLTIWPPYLEGSSAPATMPANVTVIKRSDGSMQYAYKGMPLYYYFKDAKTGDTIGDGVGGFHLVKP